MEIYSRFFKLHELIREQLQIGYIGPLFGKNNVSAYFISVAPPWNYYGLHNKTVQPHKWITGVHE